MLGAGDILGSLGVTGDRHTCPMRYNLSLLDYVLLLRFGPKFNVLSLKPLINYTAIA